jgi:hypothetical protein
VYGLFFAERIKFHFMNLSPRFLFVMAAFTGWLPGHASGLEPAALRCDPLKAFSFCAVSSTAR